jgi:hypothetical protein
MKWFVLNLTFLLFISQLLFVSSDDPTVVPVAEPVPASAPTPALTTTSTPAPTPAAVVVPECPYKTADNGSLICADAKYYASIPQLFECANEIKIEFGKICKSKTFSSFSLSY